MLYNNNIHLFETVSQNTRVLIYCSFVSKMPLCLQTLLIKSKMVGYFCAMALVFKEIVTVAKLSSALVNKVQDY
jgi:hypothetical protein